MCTRFSISNSSNGIIVQDRENIFNYPSKKYRMKQQALKRKFYVFELHKFSICISQNFDHTRNYQHTETERIQKKLLTTQNSQVLNISRIVNGLAQPQIAHSKVECNDLAFEARFYFVLKQTSVLFMSKRQNLLP